MENSAYEVAKADLDTTEKPVAALNTATMAFVAAYKALPEELHAVEAIFPWGISQLWVIWAKQCVGIISITLVKSVMSRHCLECNERCFSKLWPVSSGWSLRFVR